jgi:integrase
VPARLPRRRARSFRGPVDDGDRASIIDMLARLHTAIPRAYRRAWMPALKVVGLEGVHLHDLRHTGNQFSADAGANIRELMERMGHDSTRAALIYLHSSATRQRAIADQVGRNAKAALTKSNDRARNRDRKPRDPPQGTKAGSEMHRFECTRQDSNPRPAA